MEVQVLRGYHLTNNEEHDALLQPKRFRLIWYNSFIIMSGMKYIITQKGMDEPTDPREITADSDKEAAMEAYEVPATEQECKKQYDLTRDQTLAYMIREDFAGDVSILNRKTKSKVNIEPFQIEIPEE